MSPYFSALSHNISSLINDVRSTTHGSEHGDRNDQRDISLSTSRNTYRRLNGDTLASARGDTTTTSLHGIVEEEDEDEEEEQEDDEEDDSDSSSPSYNAATTSSTSASFHHHHQKVRSNPVFSLFVVIGIGWTAGLYLTYPFPTTIPLFVGSLIILFGWTITTLSDLLVSLLRRRDSTPTIMARYTRLRKLGLAISTVFLIYLFNLGFTPQLSTQALPAADGSNGKYFIAANMHNNEAVLSEWSSQLIKLIFHLGRDNVYVSIYESNSRDSTKHLLSVLNTTLENLSIEHRIITDQDNKHWWPYATAVERIEYLANARNIAIEPLQSSDPHVRLDGYRDFSKILFFNDVWFDWRDIVKLLNTRYTSDSQEEEEEYDQVCAMDFGPSGLYDTWVARDVCGTPLRPFWPYVKDGESIERIRRGEPVRVTACWNGVTVLNARPLLFRESEESSIGDEFGLEKRGWRMIDNASYPNSVSSPPLTHQHPIEFRTSNISQCDHSECFLISYDLHRYYPNRPVRTYMNPEVKVAYERNWFNWQNVVLEIPIIKWWLTHWSRGYPFLLVDWIWEHFGRKRDYCTWSALGWHAPERCPSLPGPPHTSWDQ